MATNNHPTRRAAKIKRDAAPETAPTEKQVRKSRKEKLSKTGKIIVVAIGIAAMLLSVSALACSGLLNQASSDPNSYELTGGVAATVNGVNIKEDTVTKQIMSLRQSSYQSDKEWATYLADQGLTPETYREDVIDNYVQQYLLTEAQREKQIKVTQDDLDSAWNDAVNSYGGDEGTFLEFISQMGFDKATYMESLKGSIAQDKLKDAVAPHKDATDEEIIAAINEDIDTYNNARRSSHILFKVAEDATDEERAKVEAEAQQVLDQINAGQIEFEAAAKEHSEDTSAEKGGDVGWDKLTTFVTEYQDALSALSVGQVSGLVKTTYGYHIIKCTDHFNVEGAVASIDQVPEDIKNQVAEGLETEARGEAYDAWLKEYTENADVHINKMPENVPYNVDMSLAESAGTEGEAAESEGTGEGEPASE